MTSDQIETWKLPNHHGPIDREEATILMLREISFPTGALE